MKKTVFNLIDGIRGTHKADAHFDIFISILIVLNVIVVFLESYAQINDVYGVFFKVFEAVSILVFTLEYSLRIWTADYLYPHLSPFKARLKFVFSFLGLVDLLAILPFFLPLFFKTDLRIIRALRLVRLMRIFKLTRHSKSLKMIGEVLKETRYDLMVTIFATIIMLIVASTLMFSLENEAQPEAFDNIGQSLWWAVATLTTVGYGDIYPITGMGKLLSGVIALLGIGIVALPTGIISSAFVEKIRERKKEKEEGRPVVHNCPHCGEKL